ncbi:hypothetical protein [Pyrococcus kukulkanii]|uniref:Uncharacterized protein n=1 Tax=Pyrococcus kukulkanii TaxID=1609559 RepID=A0ABV4T348_9EURY
MRIFIRNYLLPWLLIIAFWLAIWLLGSQIGKSLNVMNVFVAFLLLVPFLLVAFHFVGKVLERYGYSREDIRRLPEIIEKTHERLYIAKEIFDIIGKALIFWGLMATAVVMTRDPLKGLLNGIAIFARIFALFIILVSMVIWVMAFPHCLYKLFIGRELNRGFLVELMRQNIFYTVVLIAVRIIALRSGYPAGDDPIGELMALGRSSNIVNLLLKLSGLNFLFTVIGLYGPKNSRKLTALALTLIVITQVWIVRVIIFWIAKVK